MACKHTPFSLGGQAPSRTAVPALVTVTEQAEPLPEYGDRGVRVAGMGGASTRPYKSPREAGWGWGALDLPLSADVPVPGWRRGSPIPAVLLAPAAPRTQNSTFTRGQPCESRPRTPPQQGLRRPAPFRESLPGLGPRPMGRAFHPRAAWDWGLRARGGGLMRRRRAGGGDLNSPEKEECLTLPTVGSARDSQRGLLATSPSRPVVPGPASGDPRRPRRCAPLRPPSLWHRSRPDRHFEQYGRKKKKKKKDRKKERKRLSE